MSLIIIIIIKQLETSTKLNICFKINIINRKLVIEDFVLVIIEVFFPLRNTYVKYDGN